MTRKLGNNKFLAPVLEMELVTHIDKEKSKGSSDITSVCGDLKIEVLAFSLYRHLWVE